MIEGADAAVLEAHGELSLARIALAEDDLCHAANHIAGALTHAPTLPEVHELLAVLAARCPDGGLSLFPIDGQPYVGTVVTHAHLLAATDADSALILLAKATAFAPDMPWADVSWVREQPLEAIDPGALVQVFVAMMRSVEDSASDAIRAANEVYLDLASRAVEAYPNHALVQASAAGVCRRLGDTALAVRWGERAVRLEATKLTRVWYAYALKADGQLDAALETMRLASQDNPLDLDLFADRANWMASAGRIEEALELLDEAMATDPSYDCVVHTAHRLRYQHDGDPQHLVELADFVRNNPDNGHEHSDLEDSCEGQGWLGEITGTSEACINMLAQVPREKRSTGTSVCLSALEVPSAIAVLRREFPGVEVEIAGPPPADMVTALRPGRVLWRYDGTTAHPAVEPPSQRASTLLAEIATPFWPHPIAAYDQAMPLGQLSAEELVALLVHPPARPSRLDGLPDAYWERCAQVFACLGILHCVELGSGIPGDTAAQRALLTEIAFGIEDWTTEAALFALTVAAWVAPDCREEVRETVGTRFVEAVQVSRDREVTIIYSLALLTRIVPGMYPEVANLARDLLNHYESEENTDTPPTD